MAERSARRNKKEKIKEIEEVSRDAVQSELATLNEDSIRGFNGNKLLKRAGEKVELTPEHIEEYKKCMKDPVYFAERYIKIINIDTGLQTIKLYDYQKRLLKAFQENRFNIVLACRQSGKTTSYVAFILWYVVFHSDKAIAVLANKGATSRGIVERIELALMYLPKWIAPGITSFNKGSFSLDNGSSVTSGSTTSDSVRGSSFAMLIVDECVTGDTKITIRNKITGDIKEVSMEEFWNIL